jgi:DNA-binding winged helix-turn-helix (wHTH) protein
MKMIDRAHYAVLTTTGWVQLTPVRWRLFKALLDRRGTIVPHAAIASAVWGRRRPASESAIREAIRQLRADLSGSTLEVKTHRRRGYELASKETA